MNLGHEFKNFVAFLMKREFPRLCRGGSQTLRIPGVYLPLLPSFCRSPLPREPRAVAVASAFQRLRSGPFEGPATVKPPALPEDTYSRPVLALFFAHRAFAALSATSWRCSAVMVTMRRFPPILPPLRPIADITRDMSESETFGALASRSAVRVERRTILKAP